MLSPRNISLFYDIGTSNFPYFLQDKDLAITQTKIYLKPQPGKSITMPAGMKINGTEILWNVDDDVSYSGSNGNINKIKGGTVEISGSPIKKWDMDAGVIGLIKEEIDDILILIKYRI